MSKTHDEVHALPLEESVQYLLEECRIVLPGIQMLFGFQLATVFTVPFAQALTASEQELHLLATALVAIAIALIMAPAAYHRQAEPQQVSRTFVTVATRLLLTSLPPLAIAICLDFYLVARMVLKEAWVAWLAVAMFAVFVALWFVLPRIARARRQRREPHPQQPHSSPKA